MSGKLEKLSEKYPTFIPSVIAIVMLLLAIPPMWPYGYYTLLRWVVCGTSVFIAVTAYELSRKGWMYFIGLIALLFNPFIPVYLDKETWIVIDLIVAVIIFISIWFMKKTNLYHKTKKAN